MIALALALVLASDPPADPAPVAGPARGTLSKSAQRAAARNARPAPAPAPAPEPAEDPGKLLLASKCGKCHDLDRATGSTLSESGWKLHLKRMGKLPGAAITDDQARQIHAYLKTSGPAPRP